MSGDWIKMRVSLLTHPKVIRVASALKADRLRAVGAIFAVWSVFDQHSEDGRLDGYTAQAMDDAVGCKGITAAMEAIHWLEIDADGITAVEFGEHNGASAKRRASETKRKQIDREADKSAHGSWTSSGQLSASDADKTRDNLRTREELEKKENPPTPRRGGGEGRFPEFWSTWPASDRKQDRKKCLGRWQRGNLDSEADAILAHVIASKQTRKWRDGFEPAPLTYLNGERWKDGATEVQSQDEGFL